MAAASLLAREPTSPLAPPSALSPTSISHDLACMPASGRPVLTLPPAPPCSPLLPPADKEEDELIQMRRTIARLEEEEALLVREMSAALLELGTQVQLDRDD